MYRDIYFTCILQAKALGGGHLYL